jgi:hypothetical protein
MGTAKGRNDRMKQNIYVAVLGTALVALMSFISACSGSATAAEKPPLNRQP